MIDLTSPFGRKAKRHLRDEYIIWLTTVGPDGTPHPRPVWFTWDGESFLIYSQPRAHKVRHILAHPQVALHFNTDATGDTDVVVFTGTAAIVSDAPPANKHAAYLRKYRTGIAALSVENTPAKFAAEYSTAIRVTPERVRGW